MISHGLTEEQLSKLKRSFVLKLTKDLWVSEAGTGLRKEVDQHNDRRLVEKQSHVRLILAPLTSIEPSSRHLSVLFALP
jgi:hypothetical protein